MNETIAMILLVLMLWAWITSFMLYGRVLEKRVGRLEWTLRQNDDTEISWLMRELGKSGHHVTVRYDPLREQKPFTVVIDTYRLGDTEEPEKLLRKAVSLREERSDSTC